LSESDFPLKQHVLEQMKGLSGAEYLLSHYDGQPPTTTLPVEAVAMPLEAVSEDWQTMSLGPRVTLAGQTFLCSGLSLRQRRADSGSILYILYPETLWRDALWEAVRPSLVLGAFGGLASIALAVGVAQRLGRRIQELERRTRLIAAGDFSPMPLPG